MDWFKKYYEKIMLAGALVLLIVVAAGLVFKIKDIAATLRLPEPGNKALAAVDLSSYSNALASLKSPPRWDHTAPGTLFPPAIVRVVTNKPVRVDQIFTVERVTRRPFLLRFQTYVWEANDGVGRTFQINFVTERRSFFVEKVGKEVADKFRRTGYVITDFKRKFKPVEISGIKREDDVSELTVKHTGEEPIVLVYNKDATYPKLFADIRYKEEPVSVVSIDDTFKGGGNNYKVIDITDKEVIIEDIKSGEKHKLVPLSATP
jgi:hypothetical protein